MTALVIDIIIVLVALCSTFFDYPLTLHVQFMARQALERQRLSSIIEILTIPCVYSIILSLSIIHWLPI